MRRHALALALAAALAVADAARADDAASGEEAAAAAQSANHQSWATASAGRGLAASSSGRLNSAAQPRTMLCAKSGRRGEEHWQLRPWPK